LLVYIYLYIYILFIYVTTVIIFCVVWAYWSGALSKDSFDHASNVIRLPVLISAPQYEMYQSAI